jgi:hypothetical protein
VGEVHADGAIFAGGIQTFCNHLGLWNVRFLIPSDLQNTFDKLILKSLTLSRNEETFDDQYNRILSLISSTTSLLSSYTEMAQKEFDTRILKCVRVGAYIDSDTPTFFLPFARPINPESSLSTIPAKILLSARTSDWAVSITWMQKASTVFGSFTLGYAKAPLFAYVNTCDFQLDTQDLSRVDEVCPANRVELTSGRLEYRFDGDGRQLYVLFAHDHPAGITMFSTTFEFQGVLLLVYHLFRIYI